MLPPSALFTVDSFPLSFHVFKDDFRAQFERNLEDELENADDLNEQLSADHEDLNTDQVSILLIISFLQS